MATRNWIHVINGIISPPGGASRPTRRNPDEAMRKRSRLDDDELRRARRQSTPRPTFHVQLLCHRNIPANPKMNTIRFRFFGFTDMFSFVRNGRLIFWRMAEGHASTAVTQIMQQFDETKGRNSLVGHAPISLNTHVWIIKQFLLSLCHTN